MTRESSEESLKTVAFIQLASIGTRSLIIYIRLVIWARTMIHFHAFRVVRFALINILSSMSKPAL